MKVHKFTLKLPKFEQYEEGSQVRKSSKGITSCIVEGYGRKKYKADFLKFLIHSHASCDETIVHLNFLKDTHELDFNELDYFLEKYDELGRKINKYIQYVEKEWKSARQSELRYAMLNSKRVTRNSQHENKEINNHV